MNVITEEFIEKNGFFKKEKNTWFKQLPKEYRDTGRYIKIRKLIINKKYSWYISLNNPTKGSGKFYINYIDEFEDIMRLCGF